MVCHANGEGGVYFGKTKHFQRIICVRGSFRHEMVKSFAVIVRMSAISIIMMEVVLSAYVLITFGCEMMHYDVLHRKLLSFCCKRQKINGFAEMLDNIYIYIYIYHGVCETALMRGREFIE